MKNIGIVVNPRKANAIEAVKLFIEQIASKSHSYLISESNMSSIKNFPGAIKVVSDKIFLKESELILTFGGDGTILRTVKMVGGLEIPILGVNMGSLGFLAATSIEQVKSHIDEFFTNKFLTEKRSLLNLSIEQQEKTFTALNDFVIDKAGFYRVINIKTEIDDNLLNTYIADGLIISTPTGSTAYSLANGGPILMPQTKAFIVNPVCPHTLTNRPVIISENSVISLVVRSELGKFNIFGDGQKIGTYPSGTKMQLRRAVYHARLVKIPEQSFYKTLQTKLGWGEDFRNKTRWNDKK